MLLCIWNYDVLSVYRMMMDALFCIQNDDDVLFCIQNDDVSLYTE